MPKLQKKPKKLPGSIPHFSVKKKKKIKIVEPKLKGSVPHFAKQVTSGKPIYQSASKKEANLKAGIRSKLMNLLNPKKKKGIGRPKPGESY